MVPEEPKIILCLRPSSYHHARYTMIKFMMHERHSGDVVPHLPARPGPAKVRSDALLETERDRTLVHIVGSFKKHPVK